MSVIYLAGGCFWGTQHYLRRIPGVISTSVGYANGNTDNPTYEQVYTDQTGYAETVRVEYDSCRLPLKSLLRYFFRIIDPTRSDGQGEDIGTRYRTGVYYSDPADVPAIRAVFGEVALTVGRDLETEMLPVGRFYEAEAFHQDYLVRNPDGYCHIPPRMFEDDFDDEVSQ